MIQLDDEVATRSYRTLRVGMVVIAIALVASILLEHRSAGCWRSSISEYYYSPARPVFVGGILAIGMALVTIKGSTLLEDALLNIAGMLAPVVGFVPPVPDGVCSGGGSTASDVRGLPGEIAAGVRNNVTAALIAGLVALVLGAVAIVLDRRSGRIMTSHQVRVRSGLFVVGAGTLAIGWWTVRTGAILELHEWSAVVMFLALALASVVNGLHLIWLNRGEGPRTSPCWRTFARLYLAVGATMGVAALVIRFIWPEPWAHRILILEMVEIGLFAAMWAVQSIERWGTIVQPRGTK